MISAGQTEAAVLRCDRSGTIREIALDTIGLEASASAIASLPPGLHVEALFDSGSAHKARELVERVRNEKVLLNWKLAVRTPQGPRVLVFGAIDLGNSIVLVGAETLGEVAACCERLTILSDDHLFALRSAVKAKLEIAGVSAAQTALEQLSELNSDLFSLQRQLANQNAELERLYAAQERRTRELDALFRATASLLTTVDLAKLLEICADAAMEAIPSASAAVITLGDEENECPPVIRPAEAPDELRRFAEHAGAELLAADPSFGGGARWIKSSSPRPALGVPIRVDGRTIGSLLVLFPTGAQELGHARLIEAFAAAAGAALRNARLHQYVQEMAITDPLTRTANRRGFSQRAGAELDRARRLEQPCAAIALDIDHFKQCNDTYGHRVGDLVLTEVARRCTTSLRSSDLFGRMGGEEFAVLLVGCEREEAAAIAENLRGALSEPPFQIGPYSLNITASFGVFPFLPGNCTLSGALDLADQALYEAKNAGRDRVCIAEPAPRTPRQSSSGAKSRRPKHPGDAPP
jgi:diguanylate cyclase (GGDEF)-like protein